MNERKAVVSVKQLKFYLVEGIESELWYKIPLSVKLSVEDIITIKGALRKISFYGKGNAIVNNTIEDYLRKCLYNITSKNGVIRVPITKNKYGLNFKAWRASIMCLNDLVCDKETLSFDKDVYDDMYYSVGVCDVEEIEYINYTIREEFKNIIIETTQFEYVVIGKAYDINGKTVYAKPLAEIIEIPFIIDNTIYNKNKVKDFMKVHPLEYSDTVDKSKYDIEKDIWTILNSTEYSYKDIMHESMKNAIITKVFNELYYKGYHIEADKLTHIDVEKAVLLCINYLLDSKMDIIQYFDTEAVAEIIDKFENDTEYFGNELYFESEACDDILDDEE